MDQKLWKGGSVRIGGACIRRCSASLWAESPILRNLPPGAIHEVNCNEKTWKRLEDMHYRYRLPSSWKALFRLLAVTLQLRLEDLTRLSLAALLSNPEYWRFRPPDGTPDEVVLLTFRESLNRLFRTEAVYRDEVDEILALPCGPRMQASLTNELNSAIEKFRKLELERVPFYFYSPCVPMFVMKRDGMLETALCYEGKCRPFRLFGKYFDLSTVDISAFHLKYASYVLYKSGERVYFKSLRSRARALPYLNNCKHFISKSDILVVVTKEDDRYNIQMWIENGEVGGFFRHIYFISEEIKSVDIGTSEVFLILRKNGSLTVDEPGDIGGGGSLGPRKRIPFRVVL